MREERAFAVTCTFFVCLDLLVSDDAELAWALTDDRVRGALSKTNVLSSVYAGKGLRLLWILRGRGCRTGTHRGKGNLERQMSVSAHEHETLLRRETLTQCTVPPWLATNVHGRSLGTLREVLPLLYQVEVHGLIHDVWVGDGLAFDLWVGEQSLAGNSPSSYSCQSWRRCPFSKTIADTVM